MGREDLGLNPSMGMPNSFVGLSCLEPPKFLGLQSSPMPPWELFAGSGACATMSPLILAVTLGWVAQPFCGSPCLAGRQSAASAAT